MNKRIFSIALIMLITLSIFVPISASAEEKKDYNGMQLTDIETAQYFDKTKYPYVFLHRYFENDEEYIWLIAAKDEPKVQNEQVTFTRSCRWIYDLWDDELWTYSTYVAETVQIDLSMLLWSDFNITDLDGNIVYNGSEIVNNQPSQGTPDTDTPEVTYTIPAGTYTFNETPTLPTEEIYADFQYMTMINVGLGDTVYNGVRLKFTTTTIEYNLDGNMTTVYIAPPLVNAGWSNVQYRLITLLEDVTVSEEFYNCFVLNTSNNLVNYNGTLLPDIHSVWTDQAIYGVAAIYYINETESFRLAIGETFIKDYTFTDENFGESYYQIGYLYKRFDLVDGEWVLLDSQDNSMATQTSKAQIVWTSEPIYTDSTRTTEFTDFFRVTPAATPTLVEIVKQIPMSGVMKEMIVILPCLIALLTAFLGLRKALAILQEILHQA